MFFLPPPYKQYKPKAKTCKRKFSQDEDEKLEMLYNEYGYQWTKISQHFNGRNPRQCRDRWNHYLSPSIDLSSWSQEEDENLLKCFFRYGNRWSLISKKFGKRTSVSVRNRCCKLLKNTALKQKVFNELCLMNSQPPMPSMNFGKNNGNMNAMYPHQYSIAQANYALNPLGMMNPTIGNNFNMNNYNNNYLYNQQPTNMNQQQLGSFEELYPADPSLLESDDDSDLPLDVPSLPQNQSQEIVPQPKNNGKSSLKDNSLPAEVQIDYLLNSSSVCEVRPEPTKFILPPCSSLPFKDIPFPFNLQ